MALSQDYIQKFLSLLPQVESIVSDFQLLEIFPCAYHPLKRHVHSFAQKLTALRLEISQEEVHPTCNLDDDKRSLVELLTSGADQTTSRLKNLLLRPGAAQTAGGREPAEDNLIKELIERLDHHTQSMILLVSYLKTEYMRHDRNFLSSWDEAQARLEEREGMLETQLIQAFATTVDDLNPQSQTPSPWMLNRLKGKAQDFSANFPHGVKLEELITISIYWLSNGKVVLTTLEAESNKRSATARLYLNLLKSGWIAFCLQSHNGLKEASATKRLIPHLINAIMEELLKFGPRLSTPDTGDMISRGDFRIEIPLQKIGLQEQSNQDEIDAPLVRNDSQEWGRLEISHDEIELINPEADPKEQSSRPGFHGTIRSAISDKDLGDAQATWIQSWVRVFRGTSKPDGDYQVWASRPQGSLWEVHKICPHGTKLIPQYAFRGKPPVIQFRSEDCQLSLSYCFSNSNPHGFSEALGFQATFTGDSFERYYLCIKSIRTHPKAAEGPVEYDRARIQLWTEGDSTVSTRRRFSGSFANSSQSIWSGRASEPTETLNSEVCGSKMLLFCNYSILIIFISDNIECKPQDAKILCLEPRKSDRSRWIRVHTIHGTPDNPAGLPLDLNGVRFDDQDGSKFTNYRWVKIEFIDKTNRDSMAEEFQLLLSAWRRRFNHAARLREIERCPNICTVIGDLG